MGEDGICKNDKFTQIYFLNFLVFVGYFQDSKISIEKIIEFLNMLVHVFIYLQNIVGCMNMCTYVCI